MIQNLEIRHIVLYRMQDLDHEQNRSSICQQKRLPNPTLEFIDRFSTRRIYNPRVENP